MKQIQQCGKKEAPSIRILNGSHLYWNKNVHMELTFFRKNADFESNNEIDNSGKVEKNTYHL